MKTKDLAEHLVAMFVLAVVGGAGLAIGVGLVLGAVEIVGRCWGRKRN